MSFGCGEDVGKTDSIWKYKTSPWSSLLTCLGQWDPELNWIWAKWIWKKKKNASFSRDVSDYLSYEHRVFNTDEFLKTREPEDQPFYKKVTFQLIIYIWCSTFRNRTKPYNWWIFLHDRSWKHTFSTPSWKNVWMESWIHLPEWRVLLGKMTKSKLKLCCFFLYNSVSEFFNEKMNY